MFDKNFTADCKSGLAGLDGPPVVLLSTGKLPKTSRLTPSMDTDTSRKLNRK